MAEVASAYVSLMPSARGFGRQLDSQVSREVDSSGSRMGQRFGSALVRGAAVLGVGALAKSTVGLEASFSQAINTIGAVADVGGRRLEKLGNLALKMGADTVFSANEAADAMLELAKGGMTAATIQAGGLAGTLQLAAAGGTSMESAATIASNAMNAFSLKGKDMASVAAALAGGANASSASVESLGMALSQVGPGAVNAGLSLNDTVGALSAFDSAGIKGSDAGTALKTMLARLIPQTAKAAGAMSDLGLDFVKGNGEFESLTNIAGQLQTELGGLTEAQRSQALTTIFGSDASRAAAVLMKEGESGIRGFIKATQDQDAAQRAADARMKGTAGAIENFKGAVETAQIQLGLMIRPFVIDALGKLTTAANNFVPVVKSTAVFVKENATALTALGATVAAVTLLVKAHGFAMTVTAAGGMAKYLASTKLITTATKTWAAVQWVLNGALTANPIGLVIVGLVALGAGLVLAYKKSETFRKIVDGAFSAIKSAASAMWEGAIKPAFEGMKKGFDAVGKAGVWLWNNALQPAFKFIVSGLASILNMWSSMLSALAKVPGFGWAEKAAVAMGKAADKAEAVASGIKKIPTATTVNVTVAFKYTGLRGNATRGSGPLDPSNFLPRAQGGRAVDPGQRAFNQVIKSYGTVGKSLMERIAKGISAAKPKAVKAAQEAFDALKSKMESKRDELQSTVDGLKDAFNGIRDSVKEAFTGGLFDVEASETGSVGQNFIANLMGKKAELGGLLASFNTLKGWGVAPGFLTQLFASGNGALITELAGMGQAGAVSTASLFGEVTNLGTQLGTAVASNDAVATELATANEQLGQIVHALSYLGSDIGKELNQAAAKAHRDKKNRGKDRDRK